MDAAQIDLERLMIFEHARMNAEAEYAKNPTDADVSFSLNVYIYMYYWLWIDVICTY